MVSQSEHSLRMSFSCHSCHVLNSKTDPAGSRHILQLVNGGGSLVTKSCLTLATQWTVARQDPLFMEFSRQENRSGCHFLLQGIFPTQGSNLHLLWQADSFTTEPLGKPPSTYICVHKCYCRMIHNSQTSETT